MQRIKRFVLAGLLALLCLLGFKQCLHRENVTVQQQMSTELKDDESRKIGIDLRTGQVTDTSKGSHLPKQQPLRSINKSTGGVRKASVTIKNDGTINLWVQDHGWIFEPGVAAGANRRSGVVGIDAQLYFRRRWGLNIGMLTDQHWQMSVYGAGSYQIWNNTSMFVGVNHRKEVVVGIRVGF